MENFVLYEEIGKLDSVVIYKGRRKGTITFLAICCVDKNKRAEITNHVRFVHEFDHPNVVHFFEWYETSNHLWLVIELCTGGTLEQVIVQDGHLPESAIRRFGVDVVRALHYLHSVDVIFADLVPAKLMLDGFGSLKLFDFSLARKEDENLDELFDQFIEGFDAREASNSGPHRPRTTPAMSYCAPEVLQGGALTRHSDLWALGCLLYEMFVGRPPFEGANSEQLIDRILYREAPTPRVKGARMSAKPSPEFASLLTGLLRKGPMDRLSWAQLIEHPFWKSALRDLETENLRGASTMEDLTRLSSLSLRKSPPVGGGHAAASAPGEEGGGALFKTRNSVFGKLESLPASTRPNDTARSLRRSEEKAEEGSASARGPCDEFRPRTAQDGEGEDFSFSMHVGGRIGGPGAAGTAAAAEDEVTVTSVTEEDESEPEKNGVGAAEEEDTAGGRRKSLAPGGGSQNFAEEELMALALFDTDYSVASVVDNPKISKVAPAKFDAKLLPVPPFGASKLRGMSAAERSKHLQHCLAAFAAHEKGPPSQKRLHLANYLVSVIPQLPAGALQELMRGGLPGEAVRQLRESNHAELRARLARVLGLLFAHCAGDGAKPGLDPEWNIAELVLTLTELLRDNFRSVRLKQVLLPPLGEILYRTAHEEATHHEGRSVGAWCVPSMTYIQISRCLHGSEDIVVSSRPEGSCARTSSIFKSY